MKRVMIWLCFLMGILTLTTVTAIYAAERSSSAPFDALILQDSPGYGYDPTFRLLFPNQRRAFAMIGGPNLEFIAVEDGWLYLRDWGEIDATSHEIFRVSLSVPSRRHQTLAYLSRADTGQFVRTSGQQWFLYPAFVNEDLSLMRVRVDGRDRQNLTEGLMGDVVDFLVAPDGQWVYFTLRDADSLISLYRRSLIGSDVQRLLEPLNSFPKPLYVFPDGRRLLIMKGFSLYLLNTTTLELLPVGTGDVTRVVVEWLSSKNRLVISTFSSPGTRLLVADAETGRIVWDVYDAWGVAVSPDDEWVFFNQSGLSLDRRRWNGRDATVVDVSVLDYLGWTPDGSAYFYYDASHIRRVFPDGTTDAVLAFPVQTAYGGGWFIQDDWAYFTLSGAHGDNIYRMRLDGRDLQQVTDFANRRVTIKGMATPIFEEWRSYWHPLVGGIILLLVSLALSANPRRRVK